MKKLLFIASMFLSFCINAQNFSAGQKFTKNRNIYSPSRSYYLVFQNDGNLVIYNTRSKTAVWDSKTANSGNRAEFQTDGNLVIYNRAGTPVFATNTGNRGSILKMQDDGNLVVYNSSESPVWASFDNKGNNAETTNTGKNVINRGYRFVADQKIYSPTRNYYLVFQRDGNLVVYNSRAQVVWTANTAQKGKYAEFQKDGNLVVYDVRNSPVFAANSAGKDGKTLKIQDDGNLVIYNSGNSPIWSSR